MPTHRTLLYAESDADLARQFQHRMAAHQMDALFAASDMAGISALAQHRVDLIVANFRLAGGDGLVVLRAARKSHPDVAALLLVEPADLKHVATALREEGFDYLVKDDDGVYLDMLPLVAPRLIGQQSLQAQLDHARQALANEHVLALKAAESHEHGLAIFDADLRLQLWNARFCHMTGHEDAADMSGAALTGLLAPGTSPEQIAGLLAQQRFQFEHRNRAGSLLQLSASRSTDGGLVLTCSDNAVHRPAALPDWRQASIDALTDLPGRGLFVELLKHQVLRGSRTGHNGAALLLLDLDGFKALNHSHGNAVCDLVLVDVARRISSVVRESDVVGRMDGDQFGVLAVDVNSAENVEIVAGKLLAAIARPFIVNDTVIGLTASIGIAFHPAELLDVSGVLKNVEEAVSQAKADGKNCFRFA